MEGGESGSTLKGTLAPKTESPSRLRGDLTKPKTPDEGQKARISKLKGTLTELKKTTDVPGIAPGVELVQRDSGQVFTVSGLTEGRRGMLANLTGQDGHTVTTSLDRLNEILGTEDGAWSRKPKP